MLSDCGLISYDARRQENKANLTDSYFRTFENSLLNTAVPPMVSSGNTQYGSNTGASSKSVSSMKKNTSTPIYSGHFMKSNLEDEEDDADVATGDVDLSAFGFSGHRSKSSIFNSSGYNFVNACKVPPSTFSFGSARAPLLNHRKPDAIDFDDSLSKLFACMNIAYSGKLTTPKFKSFNGIRINVWDKMRLNNIIWREWHRQYVQKQKPLVCSFTVMIEDTLKNPQAVVLEGNYWKRKLEFVCAEYKKWRVFYKNKIRPKLKHNFIGILELLDRVADPTAPSLFQNQTQHLDTLKIEDDINMEFSDTLFSALTQMPVPTSKTDYYAFSNADFMQPNLIGLQPTLDDFGNSDSMEPFQDLLIDVLGTYSTNAPSTATFGGSLNNLSSIQELKQGGILGLDTSMFTQPPQTVSFNQQDHSIYNSTLGSQKVPLRGPVTSEVQIALPTYTAILQNSAQDNSVFVPTTAFDRTASQAHMSWTTTPTIITQISQSQTVPPAEEFVKPKAAPGRKKPLPIAPKAPPAAMLTKTTPSTNSTSVLAQLLTNNSRANTTTNHVQKPTTTQTLVPELIASISNSSTVKKPTSRIYNKQGSYSGQDVEIFNSQPSEGGNMFMSSGQQKDEKKDCTSAEQKRRCHIKNGFELLQTLVPSLSNHPNSKVSKAAMLQKTAEFTQKLKTERQQMQEEANILQQEIDSLNSQITACQCQLPATGVPVTRQHNDQMKMMLNSYIRERTLQNWKFYVFGQLVIPLFDSFNSMVSTANVSELYRTTQTWLDQHCTLPALRPAVLTSLRHIGTSTSILQDPSKFPEEAQEAVTQTLTYSSPSTPASSLSPSSDHFL